MNDEPWRAEHEALWAELHRRVQRSITSASASNRTVASPQQAAAYVVNALLGWPEGRDLLARCAATFGGGEQQRPDDDRLERHAREVASDPQTSAWVSDIRARHARGELVALAEAQPEDPLLLLGGAPGARPPRRQAAQGVPLVTCPTCGERLEERAPREFWHTDGRVWWYRCEDKPKEAGE